MSQQSEPNKAGTPRTLPQWMAKPPPIRNRCERCVHWLETQDPWGYCHAFNKATDRFHGLLCTAWTDRQAEARG